MALTSTALRHPSLTYRLTGAMVQAARSSRVNFYTTSGKQGIIIRPSNILPDFIFTDINSNICINRITDRIPGQLARTRFALQLAAAESSARIHTDY